MEMSHWGKWIIEKQYIFLHSILYHTLFFTNHVHCFILCLKKLRKHTIFNINTYFMIRNTYFEFQTFTKIKRRGNLTSNREIKQHISQWKDKEDCSSSVVPYVILIIWMTVTIQNEAQLFHLSVIIFWYNPTAPWCTCSSWQGFYNCHGRN